MAVARFSREIRTSLGVVRHISVDSLPSVDMPPIVYRQTQVQAGYASGAAMWDFLNSNFSAAFFGAVAGGGVTYWFGVRNEHRSELLDEIRSTDAARALAFNVIERTIQLNDQNVRTMVGNFRLQRSSLEAHRNDVRSGRLQPDAGMRIPMEFRRLDTFIVAAERLEAVVLEQISIRGRRAQLAVTVMQVWVSLNESIRQMTEHLKLLSEWEAADADKAYRFYGLPYQGTNVDQMLVDLIDAIGRQTDDLAWFSRRLLRELEDHAIELRQQFKEGWFRGVPDPVVPAVFTEAEAAGLFPPDGAYSDWERSFIQLLRPTRSRRKRFRYRIRREYRALRGKGASAGSSRWSLKAANSRNALSSNT
jgi:hypothetical protein